MDRESRRSLALRFLTVGIIFGLVGSLLGPHLASVEPENLNAIYVLLLSTAGFCSMRS